MQADRLTRIARFSAGVGAARVQARLRVGSAPGSGGSSAARRHRWTRVPATVATAAVLASSMLSVPTQAQAHSTKFDATRPGGIPVPSAAGSPAGSTAYQSAVLADAPLIDYPMDDTSGTTVRDISGGNRPGTYTLGGTAPSGSYSLGNSGATGSLAARFGIDSGLHNNSSFALSNSALSLSNVSTANPLTIEFWYYPESTTQQNYFLNLGGSNSIQLRADDGNGGVGNHLSIVLNNSNSGWGWTFQTEIVH